MYLLENKKYIFNPNMNYDTNNWQTPTQLSVINITPAWAWLLTPPRQNSRPWIDNPSSAEKLRLRGQPAPGTREHQAQSDPWHWPWLRHILVNFSIKTKSSSVWNLAMMEYFNEAIANLHTHYSPLIQKSALLFEKQGKRGSPLTILII